MSSIFPGLKFLSGDLLIVLMGFPLYVTSLFQNYLSLTFDIYNVSQCSPVYVQPVWGLLDLVDLFIPLPRFGRF